MVDVDIQPLWQYIRERERIRLLRESNAPWPWSPDPIFQTYKFTNVRRAHDKTTKFFNHFYHVNVDAEPPVALYNCGVFRYHGTMEFATEYGWSTVHDTERLVDTARRMIDVGTKVYTGAYIITNGGRHGFKEAVVAGFLQGLAESAHLISSAIEESSSWQAGYAILRRLDGFGGSGFMAKEVLQDYILWRHAAARPPLSDELTWTPVGPGGRRGLNRLYERPLRFMQKESKFIEEVQLITAELQHHWYSAFDTLNGDLGAHDVQFCLCEFDKYERIRLGEGRPRAIYHPPGVS